MNNFLKKTSLVLTVTLTVMALAACGSTKSVKTTEREQAAFPFHGWAVWDNLQASADENSVILSGTVDTAAGYTTAHLNTALKNRTVVLEIRNAEASVFSENRLMKITVNHDDRLVCPVNVNTLILGEYVPSSCKRIEFILPDDFDGKLSFVFYQAELRGLQIIAFIK